jgi:hypothetical protein
LQRPSGIGKCIGDAAPAAMGGSENGFQKKCILRARGRDGMETRSAAIRRKITASPRQLPITQFAHKAVVASDRGMATGIVLATQDVSAERRRAIDAVNFSIRHDCIRSPRIR